LRTALDAWQQGENVASLTGGQPPIYFTDLNCRAGKKLVAYKLGEDHTFHGPSVVLSAVLTLQDRTGGTQEKKSAYQIETSPAVVIVPAGP
jgi:hypothetical protein